MKTLNLFLKMHFTSLSPDGQPVSLAIVTEEQSIYLANEDIRLDGESMDDFSDRVINEKLGHKINLGCKSFYSEFTGYDINRCDAWVKENVVSKSNIPSLHHNGTSGWMSNPCFVHAGTKEIKEMLTLWLSQFSDYKLNFIVDCGWFTWYKFVELMGEWGIKRTYKAVNVIKNEFGVRFTDASVSTEDGYLVPEAIDFKTGLPKLPANFPPVPIDLNDLIMGRKGFKSVVDAFNVDREILAYGEPLHFVNDNVRFSGEPVNKYNALWDAKVTKAIYEKLK